MCFVTTLAVFWQALDDIPTGSRHVGHLVKQDQGIVYKFPRGLYSKRNLQIPTTKNTNEKPNRMAA